MIKRLIITQCINRFNTPTKHTDQVTGYKNRIPAAYLKETHFEPRDTYNGKCVGVKEILHANENPEES